MNNEFADYATFKGAYIKAIKVCLSYGISNTCESNAAVSYYSDLVEAFPTWAEMADEEMDVAA